MSELYVSLDGEFLDKTRKEANLRAIKAEDEKTTTSLLWPEIEGTIESFEIKEGTLTIAFSSELGYFSFEYDLDKEDRVQILEDSIRLISKFKAVLEALK